MVVAVAARDGDFPETFPSGNFRLLIYETLNVNYNIIHVCNRHGVSQVISNQELKCWGKLITE